MDQRLTRGRITSPPKLPTRTPEAGSTHDNPPRHRGLGKIARDHHLPAIARTPGLDLVAVASRNATLDGLPCYRTLDDLLASETAVDAIAFCSPAESRHAAVARALDAGKHVLLEKPPVAALAEMPPLLVRARQANRTLFAAWHARFGVVIDPARRLLANTEIGAVSIEWKEDVRHWHPGQEWIWEPGGFGVFDPGINALSVATAILPRPFYLRDATLKIPANKLMPIAADLNFIDTNGVPINATFDWRHPEPRIWSINIETGDGRITLSEGGARLARDGVVLHEEQPINQSGLSPAEYPGLYQHLVQLIADGQSDADILPLIHAADAFTIGKRTIVAPFTS